MTNGIDWQAIEAEIEEASTETDTALASQISSMSRLTDAEVEELFPDPSDKKELARLMQIVNSAADDNEKRAQLIGDVSQVAGAVLKLVAKFA